MNRSHQTNAQKRQAQHYQDLVKAHSPGSVMGSNLWNAFWVGGLICVVGQGMRQLGTDALHLDEEMAAAFVAIVMVFLGAFLTGLGVYDRIGKVAGAGSIVPITGFANSIVACAMEYRPEGYVTGVGAKMFIIAGPVLVYGIGSSVIAALISLWIGG